MREASTRKVDTYVASVRDQLRSALSEVHGPIDHRGMLIEAVL